MAKKKDEGEALNTVKALISNLENKIRQMPSHSECLRCQYRNKIDSVRETYYMLRGHKMNGGLSTGITDGEVLPPEAEGLDFSCLEGMYREQALVKIAELMGGTIRTRTAAEILKAQGIVRSKDINNVAAGVSFMLGKAKGVFKRTERGTYKLIKKTGKKG